MNALNQEWHSNIRFQKIITNYHDRYARQPNKKDAKKLLEKILYILTRDIKDILTKDIKDKNFFINLLKSGSSYENLKIGRNDNANDDLEFDVMIIVGKNLVKKTEKSNSNHPTLEWTEKFPYFLQNCFTERKFLDPQLVIRKFTSIIHSISVKLSLELPDYSFKLRAHGTAIQLDVMKVWQNELYFSIDLVPTFLITNNKNEEYYIPKPDKDGYLNWRRSFSVEERNIFNSVDPLNGCCKKLLRVIKHIFKKEATLESLSSYHLKTVMMNLIRINDGDQAFWREDKMFCRFIDYLKLLYNYLFDESIPHRFTDENILNLKPITIYNLRDRIAGLLKKESKMEDLFKFELEVSSKHDMRPVNVVAPISRNNEGQIDKFENKIKFEKEEVEEDSISWWAIGAGIFAAAAIGGIIGYRISEDKKSKKK